MINRDLILKNAPLSIGDQIHVNHVGCEAGEDKKKRLYIKRTDRGLMAYCHHCNQKGFAFDNTRLGTWFNPTSKLVTKNIRQLPTLVELSIDGQMWLAKYYCDTGYKGFNGVKMEPTKVVLDLLNPEQEVIGYQIRNVSTRAVPKYITQYFANRDIGNSSWFNTGHKTLVITEDYLSAYRIQRDTGYSSVALLRTSLSDKTLQQIHDLGFEKVVVWLDPDQAGVEGSKKVRASLKHYLPITDIVEYKSTKEPKQCSPIELQGIFF